MPINTPVKIESTARIVVPQVADLEQLNSDPYFLSSAKWLVLASSSARAYVFTEGQIRLPAVAAGQSGMVYLAGSPFRNPTKIGFIATVENVESARGNFQVFAGANSASDVNSVAFIPSSGRWTGVVTNQKASTYYGACIFGALGEVVVKELFFFDADKYKYTDFLQDPVSKLVATKTRGADSSPSYSPRLGFSRIQPKDTVVGHWLGNALRYSEQLDSVTAWTYGGVSVTANAGVAPDGTNTADQFLSSGSVGQFAQEVPAGLVAAGDKTFSVWLKMASGTGTVDLRLIDGVGLLVKAQSVALDTTWKRCFITANVQTEATKVQVALTQPSTILAWGGQLVKGPELGVYTKTTTAAVPVGTPPSGVTVEEISAPGRVGDRLENTAWDGLFSTPVAWVCTVAGDPGIWSPVYTYDWYNSAPDPYFVSYVGTGKWTTSIGAGTGTATIANGLLSLAVGTSVYASVSRQANDVKCIVSYELVTIDTYIVSRTGTGNITVRLGGDVSGAASMSLGANLVDKVPVVTIPGALLIQQGGTASDSCVISKCIVRPKYPFLSKAPSSFAALPAVLGQASAAGGTDTWYIGNANQTFLNGVITFNAGMNGLMWTRLNKNLIAGKQYRVRVNFTDYPVGMTARIQLQNEATNVATIFSFPTGTGVSGISELVFIVPANRSDVVKLWIDNGVAFTSAISFDYIRLYQE